MTTHTVTIDWKNPQGVNSGVMAPDDVLAVKITNVPPGSGAVRQLGHISFGQFSQAQLEACMSQNEGDFDEQLAKSHVGPSVTLTDYIYLTGTTNPNSQWAVQLDPGTVYFNVRCPAVDQLWGGKVDMTKPR